MARKKAKKPARRKPQPKARKPQPKARKPLPRKPARKQPKSRKPLPRKPARKQPKRAKPPARKPVTRKRRPFKPARVEPTPLAGPAPLLGALDVQPSLLDFIRNVIAAPAVPVPAERWRPSPGVKEEVGFNLRDQRREAGFNEDRFIGQGEATMNVTVTRFVDGRPVPVEKVVTFDTGDDETEFWYNYHEALREAIDESWDDFHDLYPDVERDDGSDSASVSVGGIAA